MTEYYWMLFELIQVHNMSRVSSWTKPMRTQGTDGLPQLPKQRDPSQASSTGGGESLVFVQEPGHPSPPVPELCELMHEKHKAKWRGLESLIMKLWFCVCSCAHRAICSETESRVSVIVSESSLHTNLTECYMLQEETTNIIPCPSCLPEPSWAEGCLRSTIPERENGVSQSSNWIFYNLFIHLN